MKNNDEKKLKRNRSVASDSEFSTLNDSLGSFGIEPPKRRNRQLDSEVRGESRQRSSRSRNEKPKTRNEIRAEEDKKRKTAKLRRRILSYVLLIIAIVAVIVVLSLTVLFSINTITIKGNKKYNNQEITAVLPIEKGKNLFACDIKGAAKKLEENLPYIYKADIQRKFPSTIVVNITETPIVYSVLNSDKSYTLIDGNFKVLETGAKKNKNAVTLDKLSFKTAVVGHEAELSNEKIKTNLLKITDAITRLKIDKITAISSSDINNNSIIYDKRITIKLGNLDNLDNKIYSALAVIDRLNESNPQVEGVITVSDDKQVYFTEK